MAKLKNNLLYNVTYQVLILIVPFVTTPYVSRVLQPEGMGNYSVTTAITYYFYTFAILGMANHGNRTIAKARDSKENLSVTFWNLYYFQLIASSIMVVVFLMFSFFYGKNIYGILIFSQLPYVLSAMFEINWYFYGTEQFKFTVARNAIIKILSAIAIFLFVKDAGDVWVYILINTLSMLLGQLSLWPVLLKQVNFCKPNPKLIKPHLKANAVLFISVITISIYASMDKIMLGSMSTKTETGYYENAEKIFNICMTIIGAIGNVMLPRMSYLVEKNDRNKINEYMAKSLKYILIIAIAIAFGVAGISKEFSVLFFGEDYEKCGTLLTLIAPSIIFYAWGNIIRTQYLLPNKKDNVFVTATLAAGIVNIAFNAVLITKFGSVGAIIATVLARFTEMAYQNFAIRKEFRCKKHILTLIPFIVFGAIMFGFCKIISHFMELGIAALAVQILFGAAIYLILSFLYLYFSKDDLALGAIKKISQKVGKNK